MNRNSSLFSVLIITPSLLPRYKGTALECRVLPSEAAALLDVMPVKVPIDTSRVILSPMPGVVKAVSVAVGEKVGEGQECAVVEAMKMQNSLSSGVTGVVKVDNENYSNPDDKYITGNWCRLSMSNLETRWMRSRS